MGIEMLEGKGINVYREHDRDFFMQLRNGDYVKEDTTGQLDYTEIFTMIHDYQKRFDYAITNTELPDNPNMESLHEILYKINHSIMQKHLFQNS